MTRYHVTKPRVDICIGNPRDLGVEHSVKVQLAPERLLAEQPHGGGHIPYLGDTPGLDGLEAAVGHLVSLEHVHTRLLVLKTYEHARLAPLHL